MLFQREVGKHSTEHVLTTFLEEKNLEPSVREFARRLFEGTVAEIDTLDAAIRDQAEHWRLERMAAVDRNLLRMALYELLHFPETPAAVVINEALELARRYSGADSVEFVNGVLDALRKDIETLKARV